MIRSDALVTSCALRIGIESLRRHDEREGGYCAVRASLQGSEGDDHPDVRRYAVAEKGKHVAEAEQQEHPLAVKTVHGSAGERSCKKRYSIEHSGYHTDQDIGGSELLAVDRQERFRHK